MSKECLGCNRVLYLDAFAKQKLGKLGRRSRCKECVTQTYVRTKKGVVLAMYSNQLTKSKKRGHPAPYYTQKELHEWCHSQQAFHDMYDTWVNSDYDMHLKPTCDRLDDYLPYSLSNIQLMTFIDNTRKFGSDCMSGINTKICKPVLCYSLDGTFLTEYHSINAAARAVDTDVSNIRNVCEKRPLRKLKEDGTYRYYTPKTSMGFLWEYK